MEPRNPGNSNTMSTRVSPKRKGTKHVIDGSYLISRHHIEWCKISILYYRDQTWFFMHSNSQGPEGGVEN